MTETLSVTFSIHDKPDSVGGPITWVQRLLPALREHGIEARCLFLLHWGETGQALSELQRNGFDCRAITAYERTADNVRWVLEQLRENPPDVFVPNLVVAAYYASRWVREAGIPTVGVLHSDDAYYAALQNEFVFGPREFRVSQIVCVSREIERQVMDRTPLNSLVRRIPYGVPIPDSRQRNPSRMRIVYAGRLAEEQKRISDVARALCRAVTEVPETEAAIYGDGPDRASVETILQGARTGLAASLGGFVPSNEIQQKFLEADVIVLLSDYEGLPITLMEAMACGCVPVCLRMRSGIPELVEDGVTGLLVDDTGDSFVAAIRRLREDRALRERLSRSARARIIEEFALDESAMKWAAFLRESSSTGRARRIRIPMSFNLPAYNPALEYAEQRASLPSFPLRLLRRGRILGGRIKRRILH